MFDFLGIPAHGSSIDATMGWKWAFEHPYLYAFIIKGSQLYLAGTLVLVASKVAGGLRRGGIR